MKRNLLFGMTFLAVLGVADLLGLGGREARAQYVGVPVGEVVYPSGYYKMKVRGHGNRVVIRERGFAAPVAPLVPTVATVPTTTVISSPVVATTRVVETFPVVTAAPVIERRYITASPVVTTTRVVTGVPVVEPPVVTYSFPY